MVFGELPSTKTNLKYRDNVDMVTTTKICMPE